MKPTDSERVQAPWVGDPRLSMWLLKMAMSGLNGSLPSSEKKSFTTVVRKVWPVALTDRHGLAWSGSRESGLARPGLAEK